MTKEAWVTLVTNDTYGLGALVLGCSLRRAATTRDTVVMITPGVSDRMREELSRVYTAVVPVDVMDSGDSANLALMSRSELGITFTKLHAWTLVQYSKCVFLDADTLIIQNCDELFERAELSAAPDPGWPDCFNSGVFVFVPSLVTYQALLDFAVAHGSFDGGDQGLLNMFFREWATQDIGKHLPFIYNLVASSAYTYLPALKFFGNQVKIAHFLGSSKPWTKQAEASSLPFQRAWWSIFRENVSGRLTQEMILSCSLTGRASDPSPTPRHRFHDPWLGFKSGTSPIPSQHLPNPPGCNACTTHESSRNMTQGLCDTNNYVDIKPTVEADDLSRIVTKCEPNINFSRPVVQKYCENFTDDSKIINKENCDNQHNIEGNKAEYMNFKSTNKHDLDINTNFDLLTLNQSPTRQKVFSEHENNTKFQFLSNDFPKEKQNTDFDINIQPSLNSINRRLTLTNTTHDSTIRENDSTNIFLNPTKPCFFQNENGSRTEEFSLTGVAGALARGDTEGWRREAWEAGDVDYLGQDSFDNIWRRICECVGITPQAAAQPSKVAPPSEEKSKPADEVPVKSGMIEGLAQPPKPLEAGSPETPAQISAPSETPAVPAKLSEILAPSQPISPAGTPADIAKTEPNAQLPIQAESSPASADAQPPAPAESLAQPPAPAEPSAQPSAPAELSAQPPALAEPSALPPAPADQPPASVEPSAQPQSLAEPSAQPQAPAEPSAQPPAEPSAQPPAPAEPSAQAPAPAELPAQAPAPAEPSAQPPASAEPSAQPPAPAEPSAQPPAPAEPSAQPPAPAEPAAQPPAPAESAALPPAPAEPLAQPPAPADPSTQPPAPAEPSAQAPVPAEPSALPPAPAESAALPPVPTETSALPPAPADSSAQPPAEIQAQQSDEKVSAPAPTETSPPSEQKETVSPTSPSAETDKKVEEISSPLPAAQDATAKPQAPSSEPPKSCAKPDDCCGKPEDCSAKLAPSSEPGKEAVCSKPEKKPKETPKLPLGTSDPLAQGKVESQPLASEGAVCPKEPGTPTITPPSGPASPIAADLPEVCKLQASPSQPATPPAGGSEPSEPPVPPKRKQGKNGKPAPKGGKK